jgi:hypothetical protein
VVLITTHTGPTIGVQTAQTALPAAVHDRQLVHLLANIKLAAESQVCHAY